MKMIKKSFLLIFFAALSSSGFASLDSEAFSLGVSAGPAISWDFTGYGVGLNLGYTVEQKHTFEVEFLYMHLDAKSKNYDRSSYFPSAKTTVERRDSYKSELDEYFLFLNYRYTDSLPFLNTQRFHYYYGLGVGMRRLFAKTDGTENYQAVIRRGKAVGVSRRTISGSHKESETNAAGQIFAGLKFDLTESVSMSFGGRGIFSKAYQPTGVALRNAVRQGNLNIKSSSFTGMLEAGVTLRW